MQSDRPKQYLSLNGQVMLARIVNLFCKLPIIEKVVVVLHEKDYWWPTLSLSHPEKVLTAIGGKERVHSVLLGLSFLKDYAADDDWVLVHDAARPGITSDDINHLITEIDNHLVGGLFGLPVVDTLKQVNQQSDVLQTISRSQLWCAQTPQMFRYQLLRASIENALLSQQIVTDESNALELSGYHPKMVLGTARNLKVTFPEDLKLIESLLTSLKT